MAFRSGLLTAAVIQYLEISNKMAGRLPAILSVMIVGFGLFIFSGLRAETINFVPVSGTDATDVTVLPLTATSNGDIFKLSTSDDKRMASNAAWPGAGAYDESKYLEFVFNPDIPEEAQVISVTVTHEFRRNTILAGAKLEVWDGSAWHDLALTLPGATAADLSETKDVTYFISTPVQVNALKVRFLAYRDSAATSATTSHDYLDLSVTYTSTAVSVSLASLSPSSFNDSSGSMATSSPSTTPAPTLIPTATPSSSPDQSPERVQAQNTPAISNSPTITPTLSPTPSPTLWPTPALTAVPSQIAVPASAPVPASANIAIVSSTPSLIAVAKPSPSAAQPSPTTPANNLTAAIAGTPKSSKAAVSPVPAPVKQISSPAKPVSPIKNLINAVVDMWHLCIYLISMLKR